MEISLPCTPAPLHLCLTGVRFWHLGIASADDRPRYAYGTLRERLFKELITTFFPDFIDLFFPDVVAYLERDSVTFLDKEIFTDVTAGEEYEADLVAKARFRGQESFFLIHTEHQSEARRTFSKRMFRYFARLYEIKAIAQKPGFLEKPGFFVHH